MGLRIKEILKEKGMQVAELATLIEITPQNLSKLINEKTKPSIDTYERIAVALGVPFTDLFEQQKQNVITCPKCGTRLEVKERDEVAEKLARESNVTPEQIKESAAFARFVDKLPDAVRKDIIDGKITLKE